MPELTKAELVEEAKQLYDIPNASKLSKGELHELVVEARRAARDEREGGEPANPNEWLDDAVPVHIAWTRVMADVGVVEKGGKMKQGGQNWTYQKIDDLLPPFQRALVRHGVTAVPERTRLVHTGPGPKGNGFRVIEETCWRITGPAGDSFTVEVLSEGSDHGDKATSKASTMAQKTFVQKSLHIATQDEADPDGQTVENAPETHREGAGTTQRRSAGTRKPEKTNGRRSSGEAAPEARVEMARTAVAMLRGDKAKRFAAYRAENDLPSNLAELDSEEIEGLIGFLAKLG